MQECHSNGHTFLTSFLKIFFLCIIFAWTFSLFNVKKGNITHSQRLPIILGRLLNFQPQTFGMGIFNLKRVQEFGSRTLVVKGSDITAKLCQAQHKALAKLCSWLLAKSLFCWTISCTGC